METGTETSDDQLKLPSIKVYRTTKSDHKLFTFNHYTLTSNEDRLRSKIFKKDDAIHRLEFQTDFMKREYDQKIDSLKKQVATLTIRHKIANQTLNTLRFENEQIYKKLQEFQSKNILLKQKMRDLERTAILEKVHYENGLMQSKYRNKFPYNDYKAQQQQMQLQLRRSIPIPSPKKEVKFDKVRSLRNVEIRPHISLEDAYARYSNFDRPKPEIKYRLPKINTNQSHEKKDNVRDADFDSTPLSFEQMDYMGCFRETPLSFEMKDFVQGIRMSPVSPTTPAPSYNTN